MTKEVDELKELFNRDLQRLESEVERIHAADLWEVEDGIVNSVGILVQHICGNLNHFIGTALGNTGYERDRDKEFTNTGIPAEQLIEEIKETREMIHIVMDNLDEDTLAAPYPLEIPMDYSVYQFLLHLYGHLNYHLGQVNYLRRILNENQS